MDENFRAQDLLQRNASASQEAQSLKRNLWQHEGDISTLYAVGDKTA